MNLGEILARGGPVMYVLLGCSIVSVAIVLERCAFWIRERKTLSPKKLCCFLRECWDGKASSPDKRPLYADIKKLWERQGPQEVRELLILESTRAYERAIRNLSALDTIVAIAPLLGILGTVLGIMDAFHALDLQHMTSPGEVGHGLAEAMLTTAAGISIAVPSLIFYNLLHSVASRHASSIYRLAEDIIFPEDESCQSCTPEEQQTP